jgi:hypothetical protein
LKALIYFKKQLPRTGQLKPKAALSNKKPSRAGAAQGDQMRFDKIAQNVSKPFFVKSKY